MQPEMPLKIAVELRKSGDARAGEPIEVTWQPNS
jgi:hypothetical protein